MLREAVWADREAIAALKTAYLQHLYQGFLPSETIRLLNPTPISEAIDNAINSDGCRVILYEDEGKAIGFVIYGPDQDNPGSGRIMDIGILPEKARESRETLLMRAIEDLASQDLPVVRTWVLRDNFRGRFLFEQFGFRCEGKTGTLTREDMEFQYISYVYRSPMRREEN